MKLKIKIASLFIFLVLYLLFYQMYKPSQNPPRNSSFVSEEYPNDWFMTQRIFPQNELRFDIYKEELKKTILRKRSLKKETGEWQFAGPSNIGGRITDVEMSPESYDTIYAGSASGGVLKSTDGGQNWLPVFDNNLSPSIGDIAVDPINSSIIYVGTGEVNAGGGSTTYDGMGIFKSTDAGITWRHIGLEDTRHISRIIIDPKNHDVVYAGAMGKLYAENDQRGVYKSEDGGETWQRILFVSGKTGCIDLAVNPENPEIIYAAMWQRKREPGNREYGGSECGIYRSIDGGKKWSELTTGLPASSDNIGRIGISVSEFNPDILYAIYADKTGYFQGIYKTVDGGNTWITTEGSLPGSFYASYGWWFGNIRVSPDNPSIIYILGLYVYKSTNGGISWFQSFNGVHVDQHAMYIHPKDQNFIILGNDGGIYKSRDSGDSWSKSSGLPITQFYTCEIDYRNPERLYGGTQDNFTIRTLTGAENDWEPLLGGDGFHVLVDPVNNNYLYAESQWGNLYRSENGGANFQSGRNGIIFADPTNWNTPVVFNPQNSASLYYGTNRIYKSSDRAKTWTPISPFLSEIYSGSINFGTVTTIAAAPSDSNYIYAGTDDGNVWVTKNNGGDWIKISDQLPVRWITKVAVDPYDANTAYVTISGYKSDDYLPHIYKTSNAGENWIDISGDLPEVPLNDIVIDSNNTSIIYTASDAGVYYSSNNMLWHPLGGNLPSVPVTDLKIHNPTRTLVAATYGRSMWKYDINQITGIEKQYVLNAAYQLSQNYPNPFNPVTKIGFNIPEGGAGLIKLKVYDILGKEISTLVNEIKYPGRYEAEFDGEGLASGIYIVKMSAAGFTASKKMILLK